MQNLLGVVLTFFICSKISQVMSAMPTKEQAILRGRQHFGGVDNAKDYEYEIVTGHKKRDSEKSIRQHGCLCVDHFYDPHCGSDKKTYDNGCYFLCGQKRMPDLTLLRWGPCDSDENEQENNSLEDFDFDYETA